jgi:shikimate dehydrogenase
MHNAAFRETNTNAVYLAFQPESISRAVDALRVLPICGASITIPYKIEIMKYLDYIDPLAEKIGAVNTLHNSEGKISGYNTDGFGALIALEENGFSVKNSNILIIGYGGSARAIGFSLLVRGASVAVTGRDGVKAQKLSNEFKEFFKNSSFVPLEHLNIHITSSFHAIINTTPAGMEPLTDQLPIPSGLILPNQTVFDIVYKPHHTRFLLDAEKTGCKTVKGIEMLINQGALQFEIWTGLKAPKQIMREAVLNAVGKY